MILFNRFVFKLVKNKMEPSQMKNSQTQLAVSTLGKKGWASSLSGVNVAYTTKKSFPC